MDLHLGLRAKIVGIVGAAIAVALLVGVYSIWFFGYRYYVQQRGSGYRVVAESIAQRQNSLMRDRIHDLEGWIDLAQVVQLLKDQALQPLPTTEPPEALDIRWPKLPETDPVLRYILTNPLARQLKVLQSHDALFSEILITDSKGRLVAASNKTTDYWQADEPWWHGAFNMPSGQIYVDSLHFEDSAHVYSRDVSIGIHDPAAPGSMPLGVLKAVVNVTPMYSSIPPLLRESSVQGQIVLNDGRVLTGLFGSIIEPLSWQLPPATVNHIQSNEDGWFIGEMRPGQNHLIAFSTVDLRDPLSSIIVPNVQPVKVVIHAPTRQVLAPVRRQLWMTTLLGILSLVAFSAWGIYYADRRLIAPMRLMREATDRILSRINARASHEGFSNPALSAHERARQKVEEVALIRSRDEMEQLAQGFVYMAQRVLNYHEQLERELEERTQDYAVDLKMARDFQHAFLSRQMIREFGGRETGEILLRFDHIYKPAFSVGGDFYDVTQIDENRVGVFIADVMGHGLRSALITSVLRTLLESLASQTGSAGQLMRSVNERFYDLMPQSAAQIFATAFYVVFDVRQRQMQYCSAGHFSPLLLNRVSGNIDFLMEDREIQPALGLLRDSKYVEKTHPLEFGDLILMFTDGVTEACNCEHEEFGVERLQSVLGEHKDKSASEINNLILESLHRHMDTVVSADDICLLAIEAMHGKQ